MSQPRDFRDQVMEVYPVGSEVLVQGIEDSPDAPATVLFHTENMGHELTGLRVEFPDGDVEDIPYSAVLSPMWEYSPPKMGRPSQGRKERIQAQVTPEIVAWLEAQKQTEAQPISDVIFRLLNELKNQQI